MMSGGQEWRQEVALWQLSKHMGVNFTLATLVCGMYGQARCGQRMCVRAGRDWGQEEKGMTEDEMGGWHHRLDGREFEWTPGDGDGQGGLVCCDSWGHKESDTTE